MKRRYVILLTALAMFLLGYSCKENFPQDLPAFSLEMNFTNAEYRPVLGQSTFFSGNFNPGNSSLPLTFRISSVRTFDGKEAPELLKLFPVSRWKERYTGMETSLEEIRVKRDTVMRPLWEIGERSGTFTMWEAATSNILKAYPDSGYTFDVEVSSAGGRRYFRDMRLIPVREEPSSRGAVMHNIYGDSTRNLYADSINVWFNRVGEGSSITFKMLDPDLRPISLDNFKKTKWDELLHGFNKRFAADSTSVTYDVAFPIPLSTSVTSKYIKNGFAFVLFEFERIGLGGFRMDHYIEIPFKIYQTGDWEVIIYFDREAPLFTND